MADYTSETFQGWREDGVLHLPESETPSTISSITQSAPDSSELQTKTGKIYHRRRPGPSGPKLKQITSRSRLMSARTKYTISGHFNLVISHTYTRTLRTDPIPSPLVNARWRISRCKIHEPQFHSGHSRYVLSEAINTSLSETLGHMHISLHKFTLFAQLPAELRMKIWFFALPRQRLVEIMVDETYDYSAGTNQDKWSMVKSVRSPTSVPAMLHTCNESRQEALKYYHLLLGRNTAIYLSKNPRIYFDASVDILYLNCHHFPLFTFTCLLRLIDERMDIDSMDKVITIALCHGLAKNLAEQNGSHDTIKRFTYEFPNLQRVICVRHGITLAGADSLVSEGFENPSTILQSRDIASLERLFGAKVEFGISQTGKAERGYTVACSQVPGGI